MENFSKEPETLKTRKTVLLVFGSFGLIIFFAEFLLAWFYPVVNIAFGRYIVFHIMHYGLIYGTIMIKGSKSIQIRIYALYIGGYAFCFVLDIVGCIARTIYYINTSLSTLDTIIGGAYIAVEWILPLISLIQFVVGLFLSKSMREYEYAQSYAILELANRNSEIPDTEKQRAKRMETLERKLKIKVDKPGLRKRQGKRSSNNNKPQLMQPQPPENIIVEEESSKTEEDEESEFSGTEPVTQDIIVEAN